MSSQTKNNRPAAAFVLVDEAQLGEVGGRVAVQGV